MACLLNSVMKGQIDKLNCMNNPSTLFIGSN